MTTQVRPRTFGDPDVLEVREVAEPEPGDGQVRVAVHAIDVNPWDVTSYSGRAGTDPTLLDGLGSGVSGTVSAVGPGVEAYEPGDPVTTRRVDGSSYASDVLVAEADLLPMPAGTSYETTAALFLKGGTAAHLLEATALTAGETVLVHGGAGGAGTMAVQLAVLAGARVIATAGARNADYLISLGATPVTYGEGLADRVRGAAPDGVDVAFDLVGTDEAVAVSLELVADLRRIATVVRFDAAGEHGFRALGYGPGGELGSDVRAAAAPELLRLHALGRLRVEIRHAYPLVQAARAHRDLETGHGRGALVLIARPEHG
ncbi:UNVERIFIED_CONTAM: hypothetical protein LK11_09695 [Mumia flava]|nr:NADP-dependent oxidoreductase [Mumia flava]